MGEEFDNSWTDELDEDDGQGQPDEVSLADDENQDGMSTPTLEPASSSECGRRNRKPPSPCLSVIPEESRVESDLGIQPEARRPATGSEARDPDQTILSRPSSVASNEFLSSSAGLRAMKAAEEDFEEQTPFIQEDPRFNQTHFSKENSWEPSVYNYSSPPKEKVLSAPSEPSFVPPTGPVASAIPLRVAALRDQHPSDRSAHQNTLLSPEHGDSMIVNKQMSTPQAVVGGRRTSRQSLQKSLEEQFSDVSAIAPSAPSQTSQVQLSRPLNFDEQDFREPEIRPPANMTLNTTGQSTMDAIRQGLQDISLSAPDDECANLINRIRTKRRARTDFAKSVAFAPLENTMELVASSQNLHPNPSVQSPTRFSGGARATPVPSATGLRAGPAQPASRSASVQSGKPTDTVEIASGGLNYYRNRVPTSRGIANVSSHSSASRPQSSFSQATTSEGGNLLMCSVPQLAFGYVATGDSLSLPVTFTSLVDNEMTVNIELKRSSWFKIEAGGGTAVLPARGERAVTVRFSPDCDSRFHDCFRIAARCRGEQTNFKVKITGCGGTARLQVIPFLPSHSLRKRSNGDLELRTDETTRFSFILRNSGDRSAFVRIAVPAAHGLPNEVSCSKIEPSDSFVLLKKHDQKITVTLTGCDVGASDSHFSLASSLSSNNGGIHVKLFWGEEHLRKRVVHWMCVEKKRTPVEFDGIGRVDVPFEGESQYEMEHDWKLSALDCRLFERCLRTTKIVVRANERGQAAASSRASSRSDMSVVGPVVLEPLDFSMDSTFSRTMIADHELTVFPRR